ncbi:MAG: redox-sensing transcriptional repressor Rex [Acidobacteria bacterium]|nr:redox-sensing transcriptional repressor Rex [Acidobacteriota bacterium]
MPSPLKGLRASGAERDGVSEFTTERLSIYLRCLAQLEAAGTETVSSARLAECFHLNSAQIRKDLACIGELGIRGVGYRVASLREHIARTLGIDRTRPVVIFGAGNLGTALADHRGFNENGFSVVALFDDDPAKTGTSTRNGVAIHPVERLREIVERERVEIGIIAVPASAAHIVCDLLAGAGIPAILNFAPVQLELRDGVVIKCVDLRIDLESLSFALRSAGRS